MNLLQQSGGQPNKAPKYVPIMIDKEFTGLYTQRTVLHDPSDVATAHFYGGRPDALWMGRNVELTNRLTLQRRPGLSAFSTVTYPTAPDRAFSFELINGTIQVIIDTGTTGNLSISAAADASGGSTVYTGTFPLGGSNAYVGMIFQISGFVTNLANNGTWICTASSTTTLTLSNANGIAETHTATAVSAGAVYVDNQNGTKTLLFGKSVGAGQTYFVAVAGVLYMGDGVDTRKYTPLNTNGTVWNWGGVAPPNAPALSIQASGTAAGTWQASTWFSTMGLIVDPNGNIQQLNSILSPSVVIGSVAVLGTSSNGGPNWNQTVGQTTSDNTVTWRNLSDVIPWMPNFPFETETQAFSTNALRCICYDQATGCFFVNISSQSSANTGATNPFAAAGYSAAFPPLPGQVIPDRQVTWMSLGNINNIPNGYCQGQWQPSQVIATPPPSVRLLEPFTLPQPGHPLPSGTIYLQENTTAGTTAASNSSITWQKAAGQVTTEPAGSDGSTLKWLCVTAANNSTGLWQSGTPYIGWSAPGAAFGVVKDNNGSLWVAATSGTSGASDPFGSSGAKLYYQTAHSYTVGTIIIDSNSNRQQVTIAGTSGGSAPAWDRNQGHITTDNGTLRWQNLGSAYGFGPVPDGTSGLTWVNVGRSAAWIANQKYYLPNSGFFAPISVPLGGADVNDNTNIEYVVQTGVSGSTVPTWNTSTSQGSNETYDPSPAAAGGVVWYNNGPFKQNSLVWSTSHSWAYSFKARALDDFYSILVPGTNTPQNIPPPGPPFNGALPAPTGSETGLITTASPAATEVGANSGSVVSVYGNYSSDPQFDTIVIWRDADGGGVSQMFELTEIPNIPSLAGSGKYTVKGVKYDWVFQDFLPDTATNQFPGLNPLIPAPIDDSNNPPPSTFLPMAYNFQRIWGANGQQVEFTGGPDVLTGNPNEAFNPSDELPFLANVTRLVRTTQGLVTFLTDSIEIILGGPSTASFYSVTLAPGMGLLSYNALDVFAGEIYFFSADNQFRTVSPSLNVSRTGFPLGDQFANMPSSGISDATWSSSNVYVAMYQTGIDNAIFVADGSTGWYRCNPYQVPGGANGPEPIWSPFAFITNGCKLVQSVETAPGIKRLLVGSTTGGNQILKRDLSVFADNGTAYDANFTMGAIMLAHPGQLAVLKFLEFDFSGVKYQPTISFLLDEISGTFTPFTLIPVFDPPSLYGTTIVPQSYSPNRYYFSGTQAVARARYIQIRVDFGTTSNPDELYNMTIFGRLMVEG